MHINVNKLKLLVQQVKKQSIVYQVLCVYMCPSLAQQWMWSVKTGERETEIDREKEEDRQKITERETRLSVGNTPYGRCSRSPGILSGSLLTVVVYPSWLGCEWDEMRRDGVEPLESVLGFSLSSGFRRLTEDSNMPEVNYLLSVSWGYIKVCVCVSFNLDVARVSCIALLKYSVRDWQFMQWEV